MKYKVLTLWQPYATLLAHGIKINETRPGATNWTGPRKNYLIHAAKQMRRECRELCGQEPFKSELAKLGYDHWEQLPLGCILGAFEVWYCAPVWYRKIHASDGKIYTVDQWKERFPLDYAFGDFSDRRFLWEGKNHRLLTEPIPYSGWQGYYVNFKGDPEKLTFKLSGK